MSPRPPCGNRCMGSRCCGNDSRRYTVSQLKSRGTQRTSCRQPHFFMHWHEYCYKNIGNDDQGNQQRNQSRLEPSFLGHLVSPSPTNAPTATRQEPTVWQPLLRQQFASPRKQSALVRCEFGTLLTQAQRRTKEQLSPTRILPSFASVWIRQQ